MIWICRIDDRSRFVRVLRRFLKYVFVPPALAALLLGIFLSYVAVDHNSGGYYCDYYDRDGFFYRERQECSVRTERLLEFFAEAAGAILVLSSAVFAILGLAAYLMYFVLAPERLGLERQTNRA